MAAYPLLARSCERLSKYSSSAQVFLQLASRGPRLPVLDFLAPGASRNSQIHISGIRPRPKTIYRTFNTTSPQRQRTAVVHNPRKDDDGKDMVVEITPRASKRLKEIMTKDSNPNLALRITVESGGCHGFQYLMSLITLPSIAGTGAGVGGAPALNTSTEDPNAAPSGSAGSGNGQMGGDEDDTIFEATDGSEAKVVMDGPSLELLKGSKIDYTMELIGSQFKIVDNPLATSSCGCGTSFDIKA